MRWRRSALLAVLLAPVSIACAQRATDDGLLERAMREAQEDRRRAEDAERADAAAAGWRPATPAQLLDDGATYGSWIRSVNVAVIEGIPRRLQLDVRCSGSAASTLVTLRDVGIAAASGLHVIWRVDRGPAHRELWRAAGRRGVVGLWEGVAVPLLREVVAGKERLVIQIPVPAGRSVEVVFGLAGAGDVLGPLAVACGW